MSKRICFVTAIPDSAHAFLRDHFVALREHYGVYYISSERDEAKIRVAHDGYFQADIRRGIAPLADLRALWQLVRIFRRERFDAVHSVTPKAGLLTALAAYVAKVPVRIHIFTGQVWAGRSGFMRWMLKTMDRLIAGLDTHILVDGEGQRRFLIAQGVVPEDKARVLGKGSICGVNLERFAPDVETRAAVRKELGLDKSHIVFVFMGRLNRDKGLYDLLPAFDHLARVSADAYLLLIGKDEEGVASHFADYPHLKNRINYFYYGMSPEPERILQAGDVFVLPTYREGFGSSVIEASALGMPVICSDVYGVQDAMVDDETGLRFHVTDVNALYLCMERLAEDAALRKKLGTAGRERVRRDFDGKKISHLWVEYYKELLG